MLVHTAKRYIITHIYLFLLKWITTAAAKCIALYCLGRQGKSRANNPHIGRKSIAVIIKVGNIYQQRIDRMLGKLHIKIRLG